METNPYIMSLIGQIGISITALFSFATAVIQIISNKKAKKQSDIVGEINIKLDDIKSISGKGDNKLHKRIDDLTMSLDKAWLIDFMSRAINGEKFNMEQVRIAKEFKERYNELGGDSYVDDMWDSCQEKKLF